MGNRLVGSLLVVGSVALVGCAGVNNERTALMTDPVALEPAPAASVVSVSRENWLARAYVVEPDVLEHYPTYTSLRPVSGEETAAQSGAFPTIETAIPGEGDSGASAGDAIAAPFVAGWEVLRMPFLMIGRWPGSVNTSDPAWYDRYREPTTGFDLGTSEERAE